MPGADLVSESMKILPTIQDRKSWDIYLKSLEPFETKNEPVPSSYSLNNTKNKIPIKFNAYLLEKPYVRCWESSLFFIILVAGNTSVNNIQVHSVFMALIFFWEETAKIPINKMISGNKQFRNDKTRQWGRKWQQVGTKGYFIYF